MSLGEFVASRSSRFLRASMHGYAFAYLVLACICLVQWSGGSTWTRFNLYSVGYLLLRTIGSVHSLAVSRGVFRSQRVMREFWVTSDPGGIPRVMLLMALDLTVLVDYAHWRLIPFLEQPVFQAFGLVLYLAVVVVQAWTDSHLARFFSTGDQRTPMRSGPFRFVRHPRYVAAMAGKIAFALVFASVLGWLSVLVWTIVLLRKIKAEEAYLRVLYGPEYDAYARETAQLIPGVY